MCMKQEKGIHFMGLTRQDEENYLSKTLSVVRRNIAEYGKEVERMQADID